MKVRKKAVLGSLTWVMCIGMTFSSFAGSWQQNSVGWWWQENDGSYPINGWQWIDGNGDGVAECYYFDGYGYCMMNTQTPDGYQVNQSGAWVLNDIVQTQIESMPQQVSIPESTVSKLFSIASFIYPSDGVPVDISASSMSPREKSFVFYRYQYQYCEKDPRITPAPAKSIRKNNRVLLSTPQNKMLKSDLPIILREIFAVVSDEDIQFCEGGMEQSGDYYYIEAYESESADPYYLSEDNLSVSIENGRIKISGKIGQRYSEYPPITQSFTAYFVPCEGSFLNGYCFERLIVQ